MDGSKPEPLCEAQTNTCAGSTVEVRVPPEPLLLFRPETAEVLEIEPQDVPAWLEEVALLDRVVNDLQTARANTEQLTLKAQQQTDPARRDAAEHKLKQAIKAEAQARDAAVEVTSKATEFNKNAALWEVLPLRNGSKLRGKRMIYVRGENLRSRRITLQPGAPNLKSFLTRDSAGQWKLDGKQLEEAFTTIKPKLKSRAKDWKIWDEGVQFVPEFARAFNEAAKFGDPAEPGDMTEFSGGATLLRMFAGTSAKAGVEAGSDSIADALSGKGQFKATFKARGEAGVMLAEAKADFKLWLPYERGYHLYFDDGTPDGLEMGYFRAEITAAVGASCGASVLAEGGVEMTINAKGKQQLRGSPVGRTAPALGRGRMNVRSHNPSNSGDLGGEITAFAGAQAEAKIGGAFQWLRPEDTSKEFKDFAKIEPTASAQAGIGATASFHIRYENAKFRIHTALGACAGLGIRGGVDATIGAGEIGEFAWWFKNQVADSLDRNLQYFQEDSVSFNTFCLINALAIIKGVEMAVYLADETTHRVQDLDDEFVAFFSTHAESALRNLKASGDTLAHSLAQTKGYLRAWMQKIEGAVDESLFEEAYDWLFTATESIQERNNMYQFTSVVICEKSLDAAAVANGRLTDMRILGEPRYLAIESSLRNRPAPGYDFARNDSYAYRLQQGTHPAWKRMT